VSSATFPTWGDGVAIVTLLAGFVVSVTFRFHDSAVADRLRVDEAYAESTYI